MLTADSPPHMEGVLDPSLEDDNEGSPNDIPNQFRVISSKSEHAKKRNRKQSRANRKRSRMEASPSNQPPVIRENPKTKYVANAVPISTPMMTANAPVARTSYIALKEPLKKKNESEDEDGSVGKPPEKEEYSVKELLDDGFKYEAWKGRQAFNSHITDERLNNILQDSHTCG